MGDYRYIRFFDEIGIRDVSLVGGKNASLGELYRELTPLGVPVPGGFAVTAPAYRDLLSAAGAWDKLHAVLDGLDKSRLAELAQRAEAARRIVYEAPLPDLLRDEILDAHRRLLAQYGPETTVAVRSSATAEDLPHASFAGQHDTYLNVGGEELLEACRRCFSSVFTDRAISYRVDQGFDHFKLGLSIGVQKMVRADLAASGVAFTLDTESGFRDVVFITGAYGLGENVVQGTVDPDEFYVHKPTFEQGFRAVLRRRPGRKQMKMIYAGSALETGTRNVETDAAERERFCLDDAEVLTLAGYALQVEAHYSARAGQDRPMDMEWAKDGIDGRLYLVQARPETVASRRPAQMLEEYALQGEGALLATGRAVGTRIAAGRARRVTGAPALASFRPGEILVAANTTPDWEPVMKIAAAIVTERGGRTAHAAIVARELGIPAVVGAQGALEKIADGAMVTVSCAEGETGRVYAGELPFEVRRTDLSTLHRPQTRIMVNIANPDLAFRTSFLPNDGVGLARLEFIINNTIQAHPMALLHPERVTDPAERAAIEKLTRGYARPADFFVTRLAEGVGTLAAAFYPKPVIARLSDFKSNEYASLLGGKDFEPHEENPMLGFRGAARYTHPAYAEAFALECAAMQRVRDAMGLTNLKLMVPFCRTPDEGRRVVAAMAEHGLKQGENGLEIYIMCEIPANVLRIDDFARHFDGFSIGSNDLTQLILGIDRDSGMVAGDFDERDPSVLAMMRFAVEGARRNGRHSGICGQAPSDYPEIARYLVEAGIESISLNPDSVLKTTLAVLDMEKTLGR